MTCAEVLQLLDEWPSLRGRPEWGAVVRHTWRCRRCLDELVAVVVLAERVRAAVWALPGPPEIRVRALGDGQVALPPPTARARLALISPYLPPLLRLAADPLSLAAPWLPAASAP